jgi:hypothetical protein
MKNIFLLVGIISLIAACSTDDPVKIKQREQKKLKSKVNVTLRAAHTAYNVKRYELAAEKYEVAINKGWLDGIDLYQYADCLDHTGHKDKSAEYFKMAYEELTQFYPNHAYIHALQSQGYNDSK